MKNILVLDDNRDILDALSTRLCYYLKGCNILTASDGAQGKEILKSRSIDLILTDLSMPVVNGYMLIEHVKKHYPSIPVCVMTASCSPHIIQRLQAMGVGRWIEKPFQFDKLAQMIAAELKLERQD
jgi:CheY-like chemotaxis protein